MTRKKFSEIFRENPNGTLTPVRTIRVNGVDLAPEVSFGSGLTLGGINFHHFKNLDIAIEEHDGKWILKGFYK